MKLGHVIVATLALAGWTGAAVAQTNVVAANKYTWSENCGFMNWRDAGNPVGAQGARIGARILSGFIWGENSGWINVGDGSPANGTQYSNASMGGGVPDFGVNRDPATNALSGLAWGENVGWINFSGGAMATPPNAARFDPVARRLRGFAWGENIGWINLDDSTLFVSTFCPADFDQNGLVQVPDIFAFLAAWFAHDPRADFDGTGGAVVTDIFAFLVEWFSGC